MDITKLNNSIVSNEYFNDGFEHNIDYHCQWDSIVGITDIDNTVTILTRSNWGNKIFFRDIHWRVMYFFEFEDSENDISSISLKGNTLIVHKRTHFEFAASEYNVFTYDLRGNLIATFPGIHHKDILDFYDADNVIFWSHRNETLIRYTRKGDQYYESASMPCKNLYNISSCDKNEKDIIFLDFGDGNISCVHLHDQSFEVLWEKSLSLSGVRHSGAQAIFDAFNFRHDMKIKACISQDGTTFAFSRYNNINPPMDTSIMSGDSATGKFKNLHSDASIEYGYNQILYIDNSCLMADSGKGIVILNTIGNVLNSIPTKKLVYSFKNYLITWTSGSYSIGTLKGNKLQNISSFCFPQGYFLGNSKFNNEMNVLQVKNDSEASIYSVSGKSAGTCLAKIRSKYDRKIEKHIILSEYIELVYENYFHTDCIFKSRDSYILIYQKHNNDVICHSFYLGNIMGYINTAYINKNKVICIFGKIPCIYELDIENKTKRRIYIDLPYDTFCINKENTFPEYLVFACRNYSDKIVDIYTISTRTWDIIITRSVKFIGSIVYDGNYVYIADTSEIYVYSVPSMELVNKIYVNETINAIFPINNDLYINSDNTIYSINYKTSISNIIYEGKNISILCSSADCILINDSSNIIILRDNKQYPLDLKSNSNYYDVFTIIESRVLLFNKNNGTCQYYDIENGSYLGCFNLTDKRGMYFLTIPGENSDDGYFSTNDLERNLFVTYKTSKREGIKTVCDQTNPLVLGYLNSKNRPDLVQSKLFGDGIQYNKYIELKKSSQNTNINRKLYLEGGNFPS